MAVGWGPSGAGTALDALMAGYQWIKLHLTTPGAAGTSGPATETIRKQFAFAATGTDGIVENSGAIAWTNIAATGTEDVQFFTAWSASSAGNFGYSGTVTANAFVTGDTYEVAAGALVVSVPLAS